MNILTKLSVKRVLKQKFIYVFFVCFFVASFFYAFLISSPEIEEALNINIALVGGANFPEFILRFYIGIVGILFINRTLLISSMKKKYYYQATQYMLRQAI